MQQVLVQADEAERSVLTALFSGNSSGGTVSFEFGEVSAMVLGNDSAAVVAGGAEVTVPVAVTKFLPAGVALVLTALNNTGGPAAGGIGSAGSAAAPSAGASSQDEEEEQLEVRGSLRINIVGPDGQRMKITGLAEPIALIFPMNLSQGMQCAYWDEDCGVWAQDGLALASQELGDKMVCLTTHLTLFGAIWRGFGRSFECTQFTLFHPDSLAELHSGDWLQRPSSMSFFVLLQMLIVTALVSLTVDLRRRWHNQWRDELFLIPVGTDSDGEEEEEPPVKRGCCMACLCTFFTCLMCCGYGAEVASAMRDALDDIMSSYFEWFGQVREYLEENLDNIRGALGFLCGGWDRTLTLGDYAIIGVSKLLAASLADATHVQASASLKMSEQSLTTFLEDEDVADIQGRAMLAMDASLAAAAFAYAETQVESDTFEVKNSGGPQKASLRASRASVSSALEYLRRRSIGSNLEAVAISAEVAPAVPGTDRGPGEATRLSGTGRCSPRRSSLDTIVLESVVPMAVPVPMQDMRDRVEGFTKARPTMVHVGDPVASHNKPSPLRRAKSLTDVQRETSVSARCEEVKSAVHRAFLQAGRARDLPRDIGRAFLIKTPVGQILVTDLYVTSFMRAFLWCLHMVATLALAAAFFVSSGNVGKKNKACATVSGSFADQFGMQLGRCAAIALGSMFISGRPIAFLESLQTRKFVKVPFEDCPKAKKQLAAWRMQDRMVWVLGLIYLAACTFFVLLFLANLSFDDGTSFMLASGIAVGQEIILIPLVLAMFRPILVVMSLGIVCRAKGLSKAQVLSEKYEKHMAREKEDEADAVDVDVATQDGTKPCWVASEQDAGLKA